VNNNTTYSLQQGLDDIQKVLATQYNHLKNLEAQRVSGNDVLESIEHRKQSIESLENVLGLLTNMDKITTEHKALKESTIKFIETFNTIFNQ
jgi:paraquat-inducible protein B